MARMSRISASLSQALSNGRTSAKATIGNTNQIMAHSAMMPMTEEVKTSHCFMCTRSSNAYYATTSINPRKKNIDTPVAGAPLRRLVGYDRLVGSATIGHQSVGLFELGTHDRRHRGGALNRQVLVVLELELRSDRCIVSVSDHADIVRFLVKRSRHALENVLEIGPDIGAAGIEHNIVQEADENVLAIGIDRQPGRPDIICERGSDGLQLR